MLLQHKLTLILFRIGEHRIANADPFRDGPLTEPGFWQVIKSAERLKDQLDALTIKSIDLAVVAGSIAGTETFRFIWRRLIKRNMKVVDYDANSAYFATLEELEGWNELYRTKGPEIHKAITEKGEKDTIMRLGSHLVLPVVERTSARILNAFTEGARCVIVITDEPQARFIEQMLTSRPVKETLELGNFRIVQF